MGVMADLSGKPADPLAPVAERKFLDIDVDNFDSRMKAMKPDGVPGSQFAHGRRGAEFGSDLRKSMDDFSPAAVAARSMPSISCCRHASSSPT